MTHQEIQTGGDPGANQTPYLDWFTSKIWPDGTQSVHIRPATSSTGKTVHLSHHDSQLLIAVFNEIAKDQSIPWSQTRQAILRAFQTAPDIPNPDAGDQP